MLTAETFLTAEDAFAIGLIDEIMTDETKPVEEPEEEVTEEPKTLFDSFKASAEGANFFANFRRNE